MSTKVQSTGKIKLQKGVAVIPNPNKNLVVLIYL
jgi:hypothetical protein